MTNIYFDKHFDKIQEKYKTFFAFGQKQFDEQADKSLDYVHLGIGLYCPAKNQKDFAKDYKKIVKCSIKTDIKKNGIDKIILRELYNFECFYTNDITDAVDTLKDYGITEEQIFAVYNKQK